MNSQEYERREVQWQHPSKIATKDGERKLAGANGVNCQTSNRAEDLEKDTFASAQTFPMELFKSVPQSM
jgi:hypothetical protein